MTDSKPHPLDVVDATFIGAMAPGGTPPAPTFVEIAFAGRSNVGKSSLINCLVQRKGLVRTSNTPGCTRQVNLFDIKTRDGARTVLVDLPGYGFAQRSKAERKTWATLIEGYLRERPTLRVVCVLCDARRGLEDDDRELLDFVRSTRGDGPTKLELIVAATKVDKLPASNKKNLLDKLVKESGVRVIGCSAVTGEGRVPLWSAVRKLAGVGAPDVATPPKAPSSSPETQQDAEPQRS